MNFYVTAARQKTRLFKDADEWTQYDSGLILRADDRRGDIEPCLQYVTPPEVRAGEEASVVFKAGARVGDRLYTCTSTEVMSFRLPAFECEDYISLPCFNDLHHVCPTPEGNYLVCSTGLDLVVEVSRGGNVLREWAVLGGSPWGGRFCREIDYRKVATTKPHLSHPSFVFQLDEQIWVTRLEQRDAVCLTEDGPRIEIAVQRPHDGILHRGRIYFTTVNGNIVIADRNSHQVLEVVDLNPISPQYEGVLGWCRGLLVLDERLVWVGFTRVRKTKFMENLNWIKHGLRQVEAPTRIALYDLQARQCLKEIDLEPAGAGLVFGIYPAD